jgi:predicted TIM-barrel fold metal-dependent hydrolase
MLSAVGFARGVLVHASAYGLDCTLLLDALQQAGEPLRGVAVATSRCSDAQLAHMQQLGVRGLRFSEFDDPAQQARFKHSVGFGELQGLGPRLRALGLHAQLWADCTAFARLAPRLLALDIPLVLDHMGYFEVHAGVGAPAFQTVLALLREGRIWVKWTVNRVTRALPGCEDVRPFHDALLRANPARLLWGSDWPYLSMGEATPDVGELLDRFGSWSGDVALQKRVLVDNPAELYGFDAV